MTSLDIEDSGDSKITCDKLFATSRSNGFSLVLQEYKLDTTKATMMLFDSNLGSKFLTPFKAGVERIIIYGSIPQLTVHSGLIRSVVAESKNLSSKDLQIATRIEITKYPKHFVNLWVALNCLSQYDQISKHMFGHGTQFRIEEFFYFRNLHKYFEVRIDYSDIIDSLKSHILEWRRFTEERMKILEQLTRLGREFEIEKQDKAAQSIIKTVKIVSRRLIENRAEYLARTKRIEDVRDKVYYWKEIIFAIIIYLTLMILT